MAARRPLIKKLGFLSIAILAAAPAVGFGQQIALVDAPLEIFSASSRPSASASAVTIAASTPAGTRSLTARWLDRKTLSHSEHYRNAFASGSCHNVKNALTRSLDGKIKLDSKGRYNIGFRVSSGCYVNWVYANDIRQSFLDRVKGHRFQASDYDC